MPDLTDAPLVSVITPTRNRARLLVETLDSVAAQTLPRWEHIVVDLRPCHHCAEDIKRAATVCRFCNREVAPLPTARFGQ